MKTLLLCLSFTFCIQLFAQPGYRTTMKYHRQEYVAKHEVVTKKDKKYFRFFPVSTEYLINADFERIIDTAGFAMKTSGKKTPRYFIYGKLQFKIRDTALTLTVYQNESLMKEKEYKEYLFIPYTDLTSGEESYGGGKYLEYNISDVKNNKLVIDFNKAYNPYCAYATGYNCPIPPRENDLPVAIRAGEMQFGKEN